MLAICFEIVSNLIIERQTPETLTSLNLSPEALDRNLSLILTSIIGVCVHGRIASFFIV